MSLQIHSAATAGMWILSCDFLWLLALVCSHGNHIASAAPAASPLASRIYKTVASHSMAYCVQLATADSSQPIGCQTMPYGNVGPVRWLLDGDSGRDDQGQGAIGVSDMREFVEQWRRNFTNWKWLNGLIVLLRGDEANSKAGFNLTEVADCDPAASASADPTRACVEGLRLMGAAAHFTIPFPVVLLTEHTLESATGLKMEQLRRHQRLWAALTFSYSSISNSRRCYMRQKLLYPSTFLGRYVTHEMGDSVNPICSLISETSLAWTAAELPRDSKREPGSVLLVVTRLDTFSVFSNWQAGASLLRPSLVVMLAFAEALEAFANSARRSRSDWSGRDVALLFLTGESYSHLASRTVARRLRGSSPGLLGASGQPAGLLASHLHSIVEVGPLGFAGSRPFSFVSVGGGGGGGGGGHKGINVVAASEFPAWSALSILATNTTGLLLTDRHGNKATTPYPDWSSFTDLAERADQTALAEAANQLTQLAVQFLLQAHATVAKAVADATAGMLDRVRRSEACLNPSASLCPELVSSSIIYGDKLKLANRLERWRLAGVDAGLGNGHSVKGLDGGLRAEPTGMRLLVGTVLLRRTLRRTTSCHNNPGPGDPPVRGYYIHHGNAEIECLSSSLTSFTTDADTEFGPAAWAVSSHDAFPSLRVFARQSLSYQLWLLITGLAVTLLWTHVTANALIYLRSLDAVSNQESFVA